MEIKECTGSSYFRDKNEKVKHEPWFSSQFCRQKEILVKYGDTFLPKMIKFTEEDMFA